jgi:hypothetical protein
MPKCFGGLGFRDMKMFNQALLARQAWRLIQYPDSLCAMLLKSKYYPRGDLIDTVFPVDVSPTWKAVQHELELVKKGIIWRVGSGSKIHIWRDPWTPRPSSFRISLKKGRSRLRWVSQLMITGRREWDTHMIRTCMYPHDADEVLKIRLSERIPDDFVVWHYERSGMFSVKSAYKLALEIDQSDTRQTGSSSRPDGSSKLYQEIWSAKVPPKVRIFAWKLSQDGLANAAEL